jgi:hypothetical protein
MKHLLVAAVFASSAVVLSSCGGVLGSCNGATGGQTICIDFEDFPLGKDGARAACTLQGQTFSDSACTGTGRVGRCRLTITSGDVSSRQVYNYYAPLTAEAAQTSCNALADSETKVEFVK